MAKRFERTLVAATESTVLETDWDLILDCVDQIRGGEVKARDAMGIVHKRLAHDNPHVQLHTLTLLEAVAKNCGKRVHVILATREFMETIKNLAIEAKAEPVKNKVLELLQCWAMAFANKPEYKIIVDTHNLMKLAGFDFPSVKEADAMFAAQVAPEWEEGDNCFRCRADFGILTRKHHCRACGQIFCGSCSSKEMLLPQFGIEKPVRVCDACFEKGVGVALARQQSAVRKTVVKHAEGAPYLEAVANANACQSNSALHTNLRRTRSDEPPVRHGILKTLSGLIGVGRKSSREPLPLPAGAKDPALEEKERQEQVQREKDEEEYQLQLAMAISQSEAEAKETERQHSLYSLYNGVKDQVAGSTRNASTLHDTSSIAPSEQIGIYKGAAESVRDSPSENSLNADDPLARYLNRDYWQQRKDKADAKVESWDINPSAPLPSEPSLGGGSCAPTIRGSPTPASKENVYNVAAGPTLDEDTIQKSGETMKFCSDIREQVESMENRLRSNVARGRPIYNDTAIQGLYMRLTELHSQVMHRMNELENQRTYFESLQDHLSHITEARAAVNALREEESRKRAEQAAEEQRLRQAQMQHKLAAMRQQKHDMLMYQRQLALQRFQQQEAEIAARRQQMQMGLPQQYYTAQPPAGAYSAQSAAVSSTQGGYMYGQVTGPQAANYGTYSPHPQNPQVPSSVVPAPQQQANYAQQPASTGQVVSGYAYPSQHSSVSGEQPIQAAHTIQQPGVYASGANSQPPHSQYVAAGYAPYASSQPTQANYEQSQVVPPQGYGQPSQIYQQAQYQQMQYQPQTTPQHSYPTPVNAQANYGTSSTQSTSSEVTTAKEEMLISFD